MTSSSSVMIGGAQPLTRVSRHIQAYSFFFLHINSSNSNINVNKPPPPPPTTLRRLQFPRRQLSTHLIPPCPNNKLKNTTFNSQPLLLFNPQFSTKASVSPGCEAALASARLGAKTLLLTLNIDRIAWQPCNPAVGGPAKSQLVYEVDARGGEIGKVADRCYLQKRILNISKGPAVRALRAQTDKREYAMVMRGIVERTPNLSIREAMVTDILLSENENVVVLTTGTFMSGKIWVGKTSMQAGRAGESASHGLTENLQRFGFETDRLKTGTPARVDSRTVDFSGLEPQHGDDKVSWFSFDPEYHTEREQMCCYLTRATKTTHQLIKDNLHDTPTYGGWVEAKGPRYCPSIEDKDRGSAQRPSKNYIRFETRQKRADAKKALKGLLFNDRFQDYIPIMNGKRNLTEDNADSSKKKSRSKSSPRHANKAKHQRINRKLRREGYSDDDGPESIFHATCGNKSYTWSFKSWEESNSRNSANKFEWKERLNWSDYRNSKWHNPSDIESDDESCSIGSSSDRRLLGLALEGPLKIEDVKNAFRLSALKWHPDKHQGPSQETAEEKFKLCVSAYNSLCGVLSST